MTPPCAIVLPAAGASRRMRGLDKLLQPVQGQAILRLVAQRALQVTPLVAVTLRADDTHRQIALAGLPVTQLQIPDAHEGMAASLRAGARWVQMVDAHALMILLPDMPDITADDMRDLIAAQAQNPQHPLRASTADNCPGHPVILPKALFSELLHLHGDDGAKAVLKQNPPYLYPLPDQRAVLDLDSPEDWAAWRKAHPPS